MAHPIFIFLCGTSQVGKSEFINSLPKTMKVDGTTYTTNPVAMPTRLVRQKLGNPIWSDLIEDIDLAYTHQEAILNVFYNTVESTINNAIDDNIYIFDRTILDICGYSYCYGLSQKYINTIIDRHKHLLYIAYEKKIKTLHIEKLIDKSFPYDRQNGARPPHVVRMLCADYLHNLLPEIIPNIYSTKYINLTALEMRLS